MNRLSQWLASNRDIVMVLVVMGVLIVLFMPIPPAALDFLILANFSFAFLILLLTFYMTRPVEFSTFPSLLLIATLFRLSLNVAATRLILSEANAGSVISAIGGYVVGGNYVIGLIVFLILIVVQFVVVTSGAQRVSEVAARFTLDSMPGQQMSIDADLNMGFITQEQAQVRRKTLEKEAAFYGAMDGASKFVKGDAIAGILIMAINIIGGLVIGVMQLGIPWSEAIRIYTLLTIGDGIVTQVPALVIAVATGIIVTRSASDGNFSQEVARQITLFPKTLFLVCAALFALMALPGIPALPAFLLAVTVLALGWAAHRAARAKRAADSPAQDALPAAAAAGDPYDALKVEAVEIQAGAHLLPSVMDHSGFADRIAAFRNQYVQEMGMVIPTVKVRASTRLGPDDYEIVVYGVPAGKGQAMADRWLAIHPAGVTKTVRGIETRDPTYGLPAVWIEESEKANAQQGRYTLIDGLTVLMTHLTEVLRRESANLLTRAETDRLLERVRLAQPGLVEELTPGILSMTEVQKVLQALVREKVSIRNLEAILEVLADAGRNQREPGFLAEQVRQRLGQAICRSLSGDTSTLHVITLDPLTEAHIGNSLRHTAENGGRLAIEPRVADQLIGSLVQQAEAMMKANLLPVLLCSPDLRRHLRMLTERVLPHLRVLSMAEIPGSIDLKAFSAVSVAALQEAANRA
ncbi:flagellar biosynthesis protein FlhA [Achromobacter sp. DH1f]|uniref:flagellar biosynthesis protein FlhA n=1 Tax=Achromobacter sp. DH1f TaxID=1397275 RepID=UPI00046ADDFC|nr:flagellar biosynthesis protein FlhA [Achromobacter sp. DH1f]